ncbi:MAG: DUF3857 domain-containing protein [Fidelibacterota bacterium]
MKIHTKNISENSKTFAASLSECFRLAGVFKMLSVILVFTVALMAFDYDAEYLEINKTYQLNKDGSISEIHHNKIKLHTYRATQQLFGEDFIIYNPDHQDLTINKSVTTMVDGKLVPTPARGYNEVLPRGAVGDASLTAYREMVVTHTGLERGAVIDFEYKIDTDAGYFPGLMGEVVFAKNDPVKSYRVSVIVPKETELQFAVVNGDISAEETEKGNNKIYTWKLSDIDPVLTEPGRVSTETDQTKLVFSTRKDWDDLFEYFAENVSEQDKFTIEMQRKVNELIEGISSPLDKIQKIQKFVVNHTGYAKLAPEFTGYKIKDVVKTYTENSGTSLDKAGLLSSMLVFAGFDSYISFVSKSTSFSDAVPSLNQFDDVVVTTRWTNGETHILSPVRSHDNSLDASLSGKYLFRLDNKLKKIQPMKNFSEKANCQSMVLDLELSEELKLCGKGTFNFSGLYNQYYSLRDNDKAAMIISGSTGDLQSENTTITTLDSKSSSINADLKSDDLETNNGYIYLDLPEFGNGFNKNHIVTAPPARNTVLDLHNCQSEKYTIMVKLPENVEFITGEFKEYEKCDIGNVSVKLEKVNDTLTIERSLVIKSAQVTPENYPGFRKMIKVWEKPNYRQLIFKVSE